MEDLLSYQIIDFVPYTKDVYFRLLERMGETYWPLHILSTLLGASSLYFALSKRGGIAITIIALSWLFVGYAFFINLYSELNWAGMHFAATFIAQAIALSLLMSSEDLFFRKVKTKSNSKAATAISGILLLIALVLSPLLAVADGRSWYGAETFALHPLPTAILSCGILLLIFKGLRLLLALTIPTAWLIVSSLEHWAIFGSFPLLQFLTIALMSAGLYFGRTPKHA